jgi:hypothetical protein
MSGQIGGPMGDPAGRRPRDEARFDEELRRAARSLIHEDLPRELLDPAVSGATRGLGVITTRRALPGFAAAASAVAVLLVATAVALAPGGLNPAASQTPPATESLGMQLSPPPSPSSAPFRPTSSLVADLVMLDYRCNDGREVESPKPGIDAVIRESAVCTAPDGPVLGAVIIGEGRIGVVHLQIKGDIVGEDTVAARQAVADMLAAVAAIGPWEKEDGLLIKDWVLDKVPSLEKNKSVVLQARGLSLSIFRSQTGSYALSMGAF